MGELETTVAAPFVHMRTRTLTQMKLLFYYTQDKHWMGIDDAKKLIAIAVSLGYYAKDESGAFSLSESLKIEKIPLGFKPTNAIFTVAEKKTEDPIDGVLHAISDKTGTDIKSLAAELPELKNHFSNNIMDSAAVILLAKKYEVDISRYIPGLLELIEKM